MARRTYSGGTITMAVLSISLPVLSRAPCVDVWVLGPRSQWTHPQSYRTYGFPSSHSAYLFLSFFFTSCLSFCRRFL
ncbi:hypothetical protein B0H13DRAFT_2145960 [Mycena leptocephala]|nr:hypothetical protein B0H13DRAFT_2145960 [Mycena leptocephala]